MKVRLEPRLAIHRRDLEAALGRATPKAAEALRLADIDEDEATLAIEAIEALLGASGKAPGDLTKVLITGTEDARVAPTVKEALLSETTLCEVVSKDRWDQELRRAEPSAALVEVRLVRASSMHLEEAPSSFAEAQIANRKGPAPPSVSPATLIDAARFRLLAEAEAIARRTVPMGAHIPQGTWDRGRSVRYRLLVGRCAKGHSTFPARGVCPTCGRACKERPAPRKGTVHTFTVVAKGAGPSEFEFLQAAWGDYASLVIEPDGLAGVRIPAFATATDLGALAIGMPMEALFRRLYATDGAWRYGVKFRAARP